MCLWDRLGDGDRARDVLVNHVTPILNENLFNCRQVYQIDANFGATSGIAEMLWRSTLHWYHGGKYIHRWAPNPPPDARIRSIFVTEHR